jgi:hypothetical protein
VFDVEDDERGGDDPADHSRVEGDVARCFERHLQDRVGLVGAGSGVCLQPVELLVLLGQRGSLGFLDRQDERVGFAFVFQVGQRGKIVAGPLA